MEKAWNEFSEISMDMIGGSYMSAIYRISDGLILDVGKEELRCGEEIINLRPQSWQLFEALVKKSGDVLKLKEMMDILEPEIVHQDVKTADRRIIDALKPINKLLRDYHISAEIKRAKSGYRLDPPPLKIEKELNGVIRVETEDLVLDEAQQTKAEPTGSGTAIECKMPLYDLSADFQATLEKAKQGDYESMFEVGFMYYHGFINENDSQRFANYREAYKWLKMASENASTDIAIAANTLISRMYYSGVVPYENQSFEKALEYRTKGTDELSIRNLEKMFFMKTEGIGAAFDYRETEKWIDNIVTTHKVESTFINKQIGLFYLKYGNYLKAINYLEMVDNGDPEVEYEIGNIYLRGLYCSPPKPDPFKAERHFLRAAKKGNVEALFSLGIINFRGSFGYTQNLSDARDYFHQSAKKGHVSGTYHYAWMCKYGLGGERNIQAAIENFSSSAERGHIISMAELAILYQEPECRNYEKAFDYAKKAANSGDNYSEFVLGNLYLFGRGCDSNIDNAALYYQRALEHGIAEADHMLKRIRSIDNK